MKNVPRDIVVYDIASWLFWTKVASVGVQKARSYVQDSQGTWLTRSDPSLFREVVSRVAKDMRLDGEALLMDQSLREEVEDRASDAIKKEDNLVGAWFEGDNELHHLPSVDISTVESIPRSEVTLSCEGDLIEIGGRLIIRQPLPAAVICEQPPEYSFLVVEQTKPALPRHRAMVFEMMSCFQIPSGKFVMHGIFRIFLNEGESSGGWKSIVPNAMYVPVGGSLEIFTPSGKMRFSSAIRPG